MILTFSKIDDFPTLILNGTKIHTIREDKHNRWKVGNTIQFWWGNPRNTNAKVAPHQFANGIVTEIVPVRIYPHTNTICVGSEQLHPTEVDFFARNDGFDNWEQMKEFFPEDFVGKLIFWRLT